MSVRIFPPFAASLLLTSAAAFAQAPAGEQRTAPAAAVSSAAAPAVDPAAGDASKDYRIGTGDVLEVWVFDQKDLSRTVPVRPDGKISLPFVNDVTAAGRTAEALRADITTRLKPYVQNPEVSVMVREVRAARAAVSGAVRMPNTYEFRKGDTVLDLIAKAQGFTEFANRKDITLIRAKDGQRLKLNYDRMRDGKEPNHVVESDDIIIVND